MQKEKIMEDLGKLSLIGSRRVQTRLAGTMVDYERIFAVALRLSPFARLSWRDFL